jgi:hypothetical protein
MRYANELSKMQMMQGVVILGMKNHIRIDFAQ